MKKLHASNILNFRSLMLVTTLFLAVASISCNKSDDVFLPAEMNFVQDAELKSNRAPAPGSQSIAEVAIEAGFSELVAALSYVDEDLDAGLVNLFLNGKDQYTVFAPTDAAFYALYEALGEDVDEITDLPAEVVLNVLLYHVTEGRRAANSVVPRNGSRTIETLLGQSFSVNTSGIISAFGNSAMIVAPNVSASNGIIHVIDTVILPDLGS